MFNSFLASPPESRRSASVSLLVYRNLDQQLMDQLGRLWGRYYQAIADAVEQKPDGAAALTPIRPAAGGDSTLSASAAASVAAAAPSSQHPLVGVWTFPERSQKFNGVAEPIGVLLEIWVENGRLIGRYRGELPNFSGMLKLDLRLSGVIGRGGSPQTLLFESKDPAATGQIILEGPDDSGLELMVERRVPAGSPVPRGREVLKRR